ncbi:M20/M25/M40 family metallo-hydrolase [Acrocarpospora macrocephala]|uniref:Peptidase M20 n=1 Tax=Acrocarpospora macrocephala TaxID=150177 RepID=A0A5M3X376_9ACTN|nr:M20/M25/M40 family metallo-hydrolase [Acrocarpospora macrocephala]GES16197.1 peptidase M20 [Acrocarpospora macrocephala]
MNVGAICSDLIRIDTTNEGDNRGRGERAAAEYVATFLADRGVEAQILETSKGRSNVVARIPGTGSGDPFLIHGHLDVVPAAAEDWALHPFSGEIVDGVVWGRGAVDMKGTCAMTLAMVAEWFRSGVRPDRDLVLAFTADEEATGEYGSYYLVREHPDLFDGVREAISEDGGYSVVHAGKRIYPVAVGEQGMAWMRVRAHGTAQHGSLRASDNAVAEICHAMSRLAAYEWPLQLTPGVRGMLDGIATAFGRPLDLTDLDGEAERLGKVGELFKHVLRNSANVTMLNAGYKVNVIPGSAEAQIDGRFLPGSGEEFLTTIDTLLGPKITREFICFEDAPEADPGGPTFDALCASLIAEDPAALPIPYVMSGGTDAKAFNERGIVTYGFAPLALPPDFDYNAMFHGVNERVPVAALEFGVRVLDRFFRRSDLRR